MDKPILSKRAMLLWMTAILLVRLPRAHAGDSDVADALRQRKLSLAELGNYGYKVVFPGSIGSEVKYEDQRSDYPYSLIAPNGHSLFALRRDFNGRSKPHDILVKRALGNIVGSEEVVPTPFINIYQLAVSPSEMFLFIAGRLDSDEISAPANDGMFVFDRRTGNLTFVAPFTGAGMNTKISSLNVSDSGGVVVFEEQGTIREFAVSDAGAKSSMVHSGRFPSFLPDGKSVVFWDRGFLRCSRDGQVQRRLFEVKRVVGAIRVSPDGRFALFGAEREGNTGRTEVRICELDSNTCSSGPDYFDAPAGADVFWLRH